MRPCDELFEAFDRRRRRRDEPRHFLVVSNAKSDGASEARNRAAPRACRSAQAVVSASLCCMNSPEETREDPGVQLRPVRHFFHRQCPALRGLVTTRPYEPATTSPNSCLIHGARLLMLRNHRVRRVVLQVISRWRRVNVPHTLLSPLLASPRRCCRRRRPCPHRCCRVAGGAPDDVVARSRRAPHDVVRRRWCPDDVVAIARTPHRCLSPPAVPQTMCPRSRRRRRRWPQTMLFAVGNVPQTMLSPSACGPTRCCRRPGPYPRRCCRVADRTPDDVVAVSGAPYDVVAAVAGRRMRCPRRCCRPVSPRVFAAPHRTPVFQAFAVGTMNPLVRRWLPQKI